MTPKKPKAVTDKKLLELWAEAVIERAGHKCEYPGCTVKATVLHPHHFFSRRYAALRYDPENGLSLCARHHVFSNQAAHLDPLFKDIIINAKVRSYGWLSNLLKKRYNTVKNNQSFKDSWFEILKGLVENGG